MEKVTAHVVTHTHWDREWYATFPVFRERLLNLIDSLLENIPENKHFKHFMLDGQTIVLEDYLELRPEKKKKLIELIRSGKISVGPWYILPDEFLITGEALIRNFLVGQSVLKKLGVDGMKVGYLPDMFGHNAYTPAVLKGLGLNSAVLWRGVGRACRKTEFVWKAPNGDDVVVVSLIRSYSNGAHFGRNPKEMKEIFRNEIDELLKYSTTANVLIMNGTDHEFPILDLPNYFDEWSDELRVNLVHSTLEDYIRSVLNKNPKLDIVIGELRDPTYEPTLKDVTSTRIYLKLRNFEDQLFYLRYLEPLSTLAKKNFHKEIEEGWKLILKSQPHDSICGCSVDRVHRDVDSRLSQALEAGLTAFSNMARELFGKNEKNSFIVFNPYERERKVIIKGLIEAEDEGIYILEDKNGNSYEAVLEKVDEDYFVDALQIPGGNSYLELVPFLADFVNELNPNRVIEKKQMRITLKSDLPSLGFKKFSIVKKKGEIVKNASTAFENEFFSFNINEDGSFRVLDKVNNLEYEKLNFFEDFGDRGDEYNFSPVENDVVVNSPNSVKICDVKDLGFLREINLEEIFMIPAGLSKDRKSRLDDKKPLKVRVKYILIKDEPRIDMEVVIDNRSNDHKLVTSFILPEEIKKVINDGYFGVVEHSPRVENDFDAVEEIVPRYAMESFVGAFGRMAKFMITARGLHEYEVKGNKLFVTLLRSVGWLSRDDLTTRKGHAGPFLPTPEAQCKGIYRYRYSFQLLKKGTASEMYEAARNFLLDPVIIPGSIVPQESLSIFNCEEGIFLSSLKVSQDGGSVIARFFNTSNEERRVKFDREVTLTNMAEDDLKIKMREIILSPGEIVSVKYSRPHLI